MSISGQHHSSPWRSRSTERMNGEAVAIGWKAEQWSWRTPGTVSSDVRVPPPISSAASMHGHLQAAPRQLDRAGEPVGAGPDDPGVAHALITSTGNSGLADPSSQGSRSIMSATFTQPSSIWPVAASRIR